MQPHDTTNETSYGYCHCGCGEKTKIARQTDTKWGIVGGEPNRFVRGHSNRVRDNLPNPNPSGMCLCGCGNPTRIARITRTKWGHVKGYPTPYVAGHGSRTSLSVEERFWKYVDKRGPDDCWEWQGARSDQGYGVFSVDGDSIPAHRFSYELHKGKLAKGTFACHDCPGGDDPACVNPTHLWAGTLQDNHADMVKKGRHKPFGGKLNAEQAIEIRRLFADGMTQTAIAKRFGIRQGGVSSIVLRKTWKHV